MGSKQIGLKSLQTIFRLAPRSLCGVLTCDDRTDARTEIRNLEHFCNENGVPFTVAHNRRESEEQIQLYQPDLCIVVGWYWLISEPTLQEVPGGFYGLHNSLLPEYRGASPLVWAIANGEHVVGFSVFRFTSGMDDGDIYYQYRHCLESSDDIGSVLRAFDNAAVMAWESLYEPLLQGTARGFQQDNNLATFCAARRPSDGLIQWHWNATTIHNFVRAQTRPYPGAFTHTLGSGVKLTIWKTTPFSQRYFGIPGQVVYVQAEKLVIACGEGTAIILDDFEICGDADQRSPLPLGLGSRLS